MATPLAPGQIRESPGGWRVTVRNTGFMGQVVVVDDEDKEHVMALAEVSKWAVVDFDGVRAYCRKYDIKYIDPDEEAKP